MSKKDEDRDDLKDDADLEHEHEEGDDEDDEEKVVPAKPAADRRRARARALRIEPEDDDHDKGHGHDHDDDDDDEPFEDDDPTWWAPHAVMGSLVVIGVLGFFGVFNRAAAAMMGHPQPVAAAVESSAPATVPPPHTGPQPMHPPMPGQPPGQQANKEMFGAKHLLVMYKGSRRAPPTIERSQEDAKKRATEAMKKAKAPGAKFEDLVKEYSDEPGAGARGGDLGKFPKGSMVPEFQTALEKIKVGEVSDIVETPFGYHVILRTQ